MNEAERPDPDELLARMKRDETAAARGKLKIFFGMSPGVGKTYAMLQAARQKVAQGTEVVVGLGLIVALNRKRVPLDVDRLSSLRG